MRLFHELATHYFALENRTASLRRDAAGLAALFDEERAVQQRSRRRSVERHQYQILDAGCAGGEHVGALGRAGFDCEGADLSPEMIALARRSFPERTFHVADIRTLNTSTHAAAYHAGFSLFGTLGYLHDDPAICAAFVSLAEVIVPGGIFACEVWHRGPYERLGSSAPETPARRVAVQLADGRRLERERRMYGMRRDGSAAFTVISHEYKLSPGGARFREEHVMRVFHREELADLAAAGGWRLRETYADAGRSKFQERSGALFCVFVRDS